MERSEMKVDMFSADSTEFCESSERCLVIERNELNGGDLFNFAHQRKKVQVKFEQKGGDKNFSTKWSEAE